MCDGICDIMSYVAGTCEKHYRARKKSYRAGAQKVLEGAQKVLEVTERSTPYESVRLRTTRCFWRTSPHLSYTSGRSGRRCQKIPRADKLNRSIQRRVCDEICDIISHIAKTTNLYKGGYAEGVRKTLEGAKKVRQMKMHLTP